MSCQCLRFAGQAWSRKTIRRRQLRDKPAIKTSSSRRRFTKMQVWAEVYYAILAISVKVMSCLVLVEKVVPRRIVPQPSHALGSIWMYIRSPSTTLGRFASVLDELSIYHLSHGEVHISFLSCSSYSRSSAIGASRAPAVPHTMLLVGRCLDMALPPHGEQSRGSRPSYKHLLGGVLFGISIPPVIGSLPDVSSNQFHGITCLSHCVSSLSVSQSCFQPCCSSVLLRSVCGYNSLRVWLLRLGPDSNESPVLGPLPSRLAVRPWLE